jgi:hypothetical protein
MMHGDRLKIVLVMDGMISKCSLADLGGAMALSVIKHLQHCTIDVK